MTFLVLSALSARPENLSDRLRGMSVQVRTSMSVLGVNRHGQYTTTNVRVINLYVGTKGHIFDRTGAGRVEDGVEKIDLDFKIITFGERWESRAIGQQWDVTPNGLIRTRYYPWGEQIHHINIASNLKSCSVQGKMISSRPDGKFFFYDAYDGQPNEVLSHGTDTGSCRLSRGNVFTTSEE